MEGDDRLVLMALHCLSSRGRTGSDCADEMDTWVMNGTAAMIESRLMIRLKFAMTYVANPIVLIPRA